MTTNTGSRPKKFEHGTRACYVGQRCRCDACKKANRDYYHETQAKKKAAAELITAPLRPVKKWWTPPGGTKRKRTYSRACPGWDGKPCGRHLRKDSKGGVCCVCRERLDIGLVDAEPVRRHLAKLSKQGVGYKSVADAAGIGHTSLFKVMTGTRKRVRREYMQAVLDVDKGAIADSAIVPATKTWKLLNKLIEDEGMTKTEIARRLGYKSHALIIGKESVLARTELRVQKLFNLITLGEKDKSGDDICPNCGLSHKPADRRALITKMFPAPPRKIIRRYPCFYGTESTKSNSAGARMLFRDIAMAKRELALKEKLNDGDESDG